MKSRRSKNAVQVQYILFVEYYATNARAKIVNNIQKFIILILNVGYDKFARFRKTALYKTFKIRRNTVF